ncbi:hypothetical protein Ae406Ps2_6304c [Pseudonocardia sp. Ae406_Ps2]|nr:hypothetical protein Ae406Ps2_6304c [Pseudonocardia sp. Ae406_Ps2]
MPVEDQDFAAGQGADRGGWVDRDAFGGAAPAVGWGE